MPNMIVVLGMHRTGTSSVAGTLSKLGGNMPRSLMPAAADNEKGFFESSAIAALNDEILYSAGTNWHDWREFNSNWYKSHQENYFRERAKELIVSEFGNSPLPIVKDPRKCRFFEFWGNVYSELGYNPSIIIPLRSPFNTAQSLKKRNGFSIAHGLLLWLRHMLDAENKSRSYPRSIFVWDDFINNWRETCKKISNDTGIIWGRSSDRIDNEIDEFICSDLINHGLINNFRFETKQINEWASNTFDILCRISIGDSIDRYASELDSIRNDLNFSGQIFGKIVVEYEIKSEKLSQVSEETAKNLRAVQRELEDARRQAETLSFDLQTAREQHALVEQIAADAQLAVQRELEDARRQAETLSFDIQTAREQHALAEQIAADAQLAVQRELEDARRQAEALSFDIQTAREQHALAEQIAADAQLAVQRELEDARRQAETLSFDIQTAREQHALAEQIAADAQLAVQRELEGARRQVEALSFDLQTIREQHSILQKELNRRDSDFQSAIDVIANKHKSELEITHRDYINEKIMLMSKISKNNKIFRKRIIMRLIIKIDEFMIAKNISKIGYIDIDYYKSQIDSKSSSSIFSYFDAAMHYVRFGFYMGINPNKVFDTVWYLRNNLDVLHDGINPLWHYEMYGRKELRKPSAEFDSSGYLERRPE
ncbi:hypothetical protein [Affinirhizobium pseudoryzae]|uniref:hypothetical protein n=1 Tax=Allorhizobium pseudoryzae TaxID=379684 RepID=UPI0013EB9B61|nr:hypothetical protein [Allorhizobium pseudoryzae]